MTLDQLKEEISLGKVVLDFWGTFCAPCKAMMPHLEKLAAEKDVKLIKLNIQDNQSLLKEFGVRTVPHLVLFNNGEKVAEQVGFKGLESLDNFLSL